MLKVTYAPIATRSTHRQSNAVCSLRPTSHVPLWHIHLRTSPSALPNGEGVGSVSGARPRFQKAFRVHVPFIVPDYYLLRKYSHLSMESCIGSYLHVPKVLDKVGRVGGLLILSSLTHMAPNPLR